MSGDDTATCAIAGNLSVIPASRNDTVPHAATTNFPEIVACLDDGVVCAIAAAITASLWDTDTVVRAVATAMAASHSNIVVQTVAAAIAMSLNNSVMWAIATTSSNNQLFNPGGDHHGREHDGLVKEG